MVRKLTLAKFVSFLFLHKTILIIYKHIKTISDQLFMSVTSVCQTLYNFIHSQHHRFSGFLHLLVSQHLQALEQGSDNRTQVHRRFRQLCSLEHPQNASCMHADDTTSWVKPPPPPLPLSHHHRHSHRIRRPCYPAYERIIEDRPLG